MTTYDASKSNRRPPDTEIQIGVSLITRATIDVDMGNGEYAIIPVKDKHIFIKTEWKNYTEKFVLNYVEKHYGKA